jgi:hypothetical protein
MSQSITDLRASLFATLDGIKSGAIDLDKARAVNEVAKTIVETAKVEVDYLRVTGGGESEFLDGTVGSSNLPAGITTSVVHRLKG